MNDVYSPIVKWIEPQKERIIVPAIAAASNKKTSSTF